MHTSGILHLRHNQVYPRCQQSLNFFLLSQKHGKLFSETTCAQVHTLLCTTTLYVAHKNLVHCNKVVTCNLALKLVTTLSQGCSTTLSQPCDSFNYTKLFRASMTRLSQGCHKVVLLACHKLVTSNLVISVWVV